MEERPNFNPLSIISLIISLYSLIMSIPLAIMIWGALFFGLNSLSPFGQVLFFFIELSQFFLDNDLVLSAIILFVMSLIAFILNRYVHRRIRETDEGYDLYKITNGFSITALILPLVTGLAYFLAILKYY